VETPEVAIKAPGRLEHESTASATNFVTSSCLARMGTDAESQDDQRRHVVMPGTDANC
jgi:hypothetical protein